MDEDIDSEIEIDFDKFKSSPYTWMLVGSVMVIFGIVLGLLLNWLVNLILRSK